MKRPFRNSKPAIRGRTMIEIDSRIDPNLILETKLIKVWTDVLTATW